MTRSRRRTVVGFVLAAVLLLVGGFVAGRLSTGAEGPPPTTESAAAGFLRDMQVHHAQAVEMALLIRERTDDEVVRTVAYDIAVTQSSQAGAMYGLLDAWGLPQRSPQPAMQWTLLPVIDGSSGGSHEMPDDATGMPGLVTAAQLAELRGATGDDAVRLFLELMIAHHLGGVEMAEAVLARTDVPQVLTLARGIETAQVAEIDLMRDLLAKLPASG